MSNSGKKEVEVTRRIVMRVFSKLFGTKEFSPTAQTDHLILVSTAIRLNWQYLTGYPRVQSYTTAKMECFLLVLIIVSWLSTSQQARMTWSAKKRTFQDSMDRMKFILSSQSSQELAIRLYMRWKIKSGDFLASSQQNSRLRLSFQERNISLAREQWLELNLTIANVKKTSKACK